MAWLPMYLVEEDLKSLSDFLCSEEQISLVKSVGQGRWQAFSDFEISESGRYCLFHSESGPLPLLAKNQSDPDGKISNPFEGWQEKRSGANPTQPYFGAGHPAIFWLNARLKVEGKVGMSSFEWIGNHYARTGSPAPEVAKKWWGRLGRWVRKQSFKVPRSGALDGSGKEIWAFSSAMLEFESGVDRASNP
ncbi:hypothetical protein [Alishewanella sp. HL-SH05]|uniref:hypothetical protein n=1 Tax=Alishewanella sp. HL-SH05 TaxID=3461145 RepID=UPI0040430C16